MSQPHASPTFRTRAFAAALAVLGTSVGLADSTPKSPSIAGSTPTSGDAAQAQRLIADDLVAIIGDSITEQRDYSVNMETYLLACKPVAGLHTMQFGWGGETAEGFKRRMLNDCLRFHPTVATTCYGMNDGGYGPLAPERAKWYHDNQKAVVDTLKANGVRFVVIGSPGCVDVNTFRGGNREQAEVYNKTLAEEADISKRVASEEGVTFADVFSPMHHAMTRAEEKYGKGYHVAGGDGVHPAANGHVIMAYAFLKALGCDGNIGTITLDVAGGKAGASEGHKVLSSQASNGGATVEIESTRYPFCFTSPKDAHGHDADNVPASSKGILEFVPFNDDLNRFTLQVRGASTIGPKVNVTWGKVTKEFDAAALEKGINLAAEFPDNPFSAPFAAVLQTVAAQQAYETPMIKNYVNSLTSMVPDDKEAVDRIIGSMAKHDHALADAATASVKPVKHTITLAPAK